LRRGIGGRLMQFGVGLNIVYFLPLLFLFY